MSEATRISWTAFHERQEALKSAERHHFSYKAGFLFADQFDLGTPWITCSESKGDL